MKKLFFLFVMMLLSFPVLAQVQIWEEGYPKNLVEVMGPNGKYDNFVAQLSSEEVEILNMGQDVVKRSLDYFKDIDLYDENDKLNLDSVKLMYRKLATIKDFYDRMKMSHPNSAKAFGTWIIAQIVFVGNDTYLGPLHLMFTAIGKVLYESSTAGMIDVLDAHRGIELAAMTRNVMRDYEDISKE